VDKVSVSAEKEAAMTSTKAKRTIPALIVVVLLGVESTERTAAQTTQGPPSSTDLNRLADFAKREWLAPVISNIRHTAAQDTRLQELLDRLDLAATPDIDEYRAAPSAGAWPTSPSGRAPVRVNLAYVNELFRFSDMAGAALSGIPAMGGVLQEVGFDYGTGLRVAVAAKAPLLPFSTAKMESYVNDPAAWTAVKYLGMQCFFAGLTWTVLHEVAHHYTGDPDRSSDLAKARAEELAADLWAFQRMRELGFQLEPLHSLLAVRESIEAIGLIAGTIKPETSSTHPLFSTRRRQLVNNFDLARPVPSPVALYAYLTEPQPGRFAMSEILVPRHGHDEGDFLAAVRGSDRVVLQPFEWRNGRIHLYGRDNTAITELIIHQPDALVPDITTSYLRTGDARPTVDNSRAFRLDAAWFNDASADGISFRQIFAATPRGVFVSALNRAGVEPRLFERALTVYLDQNRAIHDGMMRYARGEISRRTAEQRLATASKTALDSFQELLGTDGSRRLRDALAADPFVKATTNRLLGLAPSVSTNSPPSASTTSPSPAVSPRSAEPVAGAPRRRLTPPPPIEPRPEATPREPAFCEPPKAALANDYANTVQRLSEGAAAGYPTCAYNLGMVHYLGGRYQTSFDLFLKAGLKNNVDAQSMLADLYAKGHGTAQDTAKSNFWLGTAAKAGSESARTTCEKLGIDYRSSAYGTSTANLRAHGYQ
jgi:hypothetical protein